MQLIHITSMTVCRANPLLWSKTLADYAQGVSLTCVFQHSNGNYGENLVGSETALPLE